MTTLQERLADLADESAAGPHRAGTWAEGVRLHRRRRAGSVAIVATALVLLAALVGLDRTRASVEIEPAGPTTDLGLPDRLFDPNPGLASTTETGPIGPLSVVGPAAREYEDGDLADGLVGISATGEYAFLDLPGLDRTDASTVPYFSLSADGTRLAYWMPGTPTGEQGGGPEELSYVGVAFYDTVTGHRWEWPITTEHGVVPSRLVWAGDTLWFSVWQYEPRRTDRWVTVLENIVSLDHRSGRGVLLPWVRDRAPNLSVASVHQGDLVTVDRDRRVRVVGPDGEHVGRGWRLSSTPAGAVFISPDGSRLAGLVPTTVDDATVLPQPVVVGLLGASSPVELAAIPDAGTRGFHVLLGWRDDTHVVGIRSAGRESYRGVVSVDVTTGDLERLMPLGTQLTTNLDRLALAEDALAGPVFDAPRPPDLPGRRGIYGAAAAVVLASALALLWWRRRVRR
jgi:hypothetical protein